MYKNHNMTQLTLPIETSVRIPQNDISRYVNEIVETIPDSELDEFRHHRGATSYHPKMMLKSSYMHKELNVPSAFLYW